MNGVIGDEYLITYAVYLDDRVSVSELGYGAADSSYHGESVTYLEIIQILYFFYAPCYLSRTLNHMAITSSAKKALRSAKKKRVFNLRRKADIEKNIKAFRKLVLAKDKAAATKMIPIVYQVLDKAVKTGYIKPNAASRSKSRAMAALKKL